MVECWNLTTLNHRLSGYRSHFVVCCVSLVLSVSFPSSCLSLSNSRGGAYVCTIFRIRCGAAGPLIFTLIIRHMASIGFDFNSGLIHELADLIMNTMVSVCWSRSEAFFTIKTFKFLELASTNMLAVTNLAICVNLALIVSVSGWRRRRARTRGRGRARAGGVRDKTEKR